MNNGTNPGKLLLSPVSPGQGNFPLNETSSSTERMAGRWPSTKFLLYMEVDGSGGKS